MKLSRFFSGLFLYIALGLMMLALFLVMAKPGTSPTLLSPAQDAQDQVVQMMDALCQGDFPAVEQYLLDQPSLGVDRKPEDAAGALIWDAFVGSFSYALSGDCYATDTGVAQDITLTYLDISSVTANLAQRSEAHLERLQKEAYLREHGAVLFPDVEPVLRSLSEHYDLCIVSNCQEGYIELFLDYFHLNDCITDFECAGRTGRSKGENIRTVVERNGFDRAIYLGDTQHDYESADFAGIPFIHAAYGFGRIQTPVPSIQRFKELPDWLDIFFARK